jgi:hypothetical protein
VNCSLTVPANARNYPAGRTSPVNQLDGRVILTLVQGTVVNVYELRPAQDGIAWARISPYEGINGRDTLWVRTKNSDNQTDILILGAPSGCQASTPNFTQPTLTPVPTGSYPIGSPGCVSGNACPHATPGSPLQDVDLISFILACEAGAQAPNASSIAIEDAIGNAHVMHNRMDSLLYSGTARQVVSQQNQWTPYSQGCNPSLGLGNPSSIDPLIRGYAQSLVNFMEPIPTPFSSNIDYMGLYTFGLSSSNSLVLPSTPTLQAALAPYCPNGTTQAISVYLAIASYGNGTRTNASIFFSDSPNCIYG